MEESVLNNMSLENLEGEIWKDILGFENLYQVSNKGRIKSLKRTIIGRWGKEREVKEKIIKVFLCGAYPFTGLRKKGESNKTTVILHKVMAQAFIPNPENKPFVNHIDGDKTNFDFSNLEWVTAKENSQHAVRTGLLTHNHTTGENNFHCRLTEVKVREIYRLSKEDKLHEVLIANKYSIGRGTVRDILQGTTWKHLKLTENEN